MDIEELKAALDKANESIKKLETKNTEVIGKLKEADAAADAARSEKDELAERAEREAKDVEALEKRLAAKFQKQIDALTTERDTFATDLKTIRVDNEITKALAEGNVFDYQLEPLSYMFKAKAKWENGQATIDDKSIAEAISEHLASEVGAHYRRASNNSGAGSTGNTSTTAPSSWTKDDFFGARSFEAQKLAASNPSEYNSIVSQLGLPDNLKV